MMMVLLLVVVVVVVVVIIVVLTGVFLCITGPNEENPVDKVWGSSRPPAPNSMVGGSSKSSSSSSSTSYCCCKPHPWSSLYSRCAFTLSNMLERPSAANYTKLPPR